MSLSDIANGIISGYGEQVVVVRRPLTPGGASTTRLAYCLPQMMTQGDSRNLRQEGILNANEDQARLFVFPADADVKETDSVVLDNAVYRLLSSPPSRMQGSTYKRVFTGLRERPFDPAVEPSCTLWVEADEDVYSDTALTTKIVVDGTGAKGWKNRISGSTSLTEATNPPTLKTNIINGKSVLRFDGTNDKLTGSASSSYLTAAAHTVFVVFQTITNAFNQTLSYKNGQLVGDAQGDWGLFYKSTPVVIAENFDTNEDAVSVAITNATPTIAAMRHESGTLYLGVNNGTESSVTSGNTTTIAQSLRAGVNLDGAFSNVDIAAILICNTALGSIMRGHFWNYLNLKYGVY